MVATPPFPWGSPVTDPLGSTALPWELQCPLGFVAMGRLLGICCSLGLQGSPRVIRSLGSTALPWDQLISHRICYFLGPGWGWNWCHTTTPPLIPWWEDPLVPVDSLRDHWPLEPTHPPPLIQFFPTSPWLELWEPFGAPLGVHVSLGIHWCLWGSTDPSSAGAAVFWDLALLIPNPGGSHSV